TTTALGESDARSKAESLSHSDSRHVHGSGRCHVENPKLHAFGALPAIHAQTSRDVNRLAAICDQRPAEIVVGGAERDRIEHRAVRSPQPHPYVLVADHIGEGDAVIWQGENRLSISGTKGTSLRNDVAEFNGGARRRKGSIDQQCIVASRSF